MSWQSYIDDSLVGTGNVDKAAIFGLDTGSVWAASTSFKVSPEEYKNLVDILDGKNLEKTRADGFHVSGERYVLLKNEENDMIGRKGKEGIVIARTKQTLIIAHHDKDAIAGNSVTTVLRLAEYLRTQAY